VRHAQSLREDDRYYGYGWWIRQMGGHETYYAWGYGGQFIFVVRDLDLVIVTTSASTTEETRRSHRQTVYDVVENFVIQPVSTAMRR
jgi:CubicO group peptidase (beta-lactamase class C family)